MVEVEEVTRWASQGWARASEAVIRLLWSITRQRLMKSRAVRERLSSAGRTREEGGRTSLRHSGPVLLRLERVVGAADRLNLVDLAVSVEGGVAAEEEVSHDSHRPDVDGLRGFRSAQKREERGTPKTHLAMTELLEDLGSHVACASSRGKHRSTRRREERNEPGVPQVVVSAENCWSSMTFESPKSARRRSESSSFER